VLYVLLAGNGATPAADATPELTCYTSDDSDYRGEVATAALTCQRWSAQTPHNNTPEIYPAKGLDNNYCRNPDFDVMPWCWTTDPETPFEDCSQIPRCGYAVGTPREKKSDPVTVEALGGFGSTSETNEITGGNDFLKGTTTNEEFHAKLTIIKDIKVKHPNNIAIHCFKEKDFSLLSLGKKESLLKIINSGIENPTSHFGTYANSYKDYDDFQSFFNCVLEQNHNLKMLKEKQVNNWELKEKNFELKNININDKLSVRMRVGRNLEEYPLPASMTEEDRLDMEKNMYENVFLDLIKEYKGNYYTLTDETKWKASSKDLVEFLASKRHKEFINENMMFKSMEDDKYLKSAGISGDWPLGRGMYASANKEIIVWVGEEDHLRIMVMKSTNDLKLVFDQLKTLLDKIERNLKFAKHEKYGYITSCPSNIGTGMRASVMIKLPNLLEKNKLDAIAKALKVSVRGELGEHSDSGAEGQVDISPSQRYLITEAEIVETLYNALKTIWEEEKRLEQQWKRMFLTVYTKVGLFLSEFMNVYE